jgi:hypothetical protein
MYQHVQFYLRYWYKSKKNVSPHRTRSLTSDKYSALLQFLLGSSPLYPGHSTQTYKLQIV